MRILGLDPAALTGWCWCDATSRRYGTVRITDAGDAHPGDRNARFADWLRRTLDQYPTDLVAYEDAGYGAANNPAVAAMHAELRGVIKLVSQERGIPCRGLNISTIKKFATGNGRAKKDLMIRAARTFFGVTDADDNACDAMFVEALARQNAASNVPQPTRPATRQRVPRPKDSRLFK